MFKLFLRLVLVGTCICNVGLAFANDIADIYQIEVIFFEHTNPNRFNAENWPKYVGTLDTKRSVALSSAKAGLPESLDTLDTLEALDEVNDTPVSKVIPATIYIVEPKSMLLTKEAATLNKGREQRVIQHLAWTQPLANNVRSTPVYIQVGKDNTEVEALVAIKPSRNQFNVSIDWIFKTRDQEFRVTRDFKVKSREIYYVDHPVISAMVIVSPVLVD